MNEITFNLNNEETEEKRPKKTLEELLGDKLSVETLKEWFVEWVNRDRWESPFEPFTTINKEEMDIDLFISTLDKESLDYNELAMLKKSFDIKRRNIVWVWANENNDKATIKALIDETSIIRSQGIKHIVKYDSYEDLHKHFYPNKTGEEKK